MNDRLLKQLLSLVAGWGIIGYFGLRGLSDLPTGDGLIYLEIWLTVEGWLILCTCLRWRSQKKRCLAIEE